MATRPLSLMPTRPMWTPFARLTLMEPDGDGTYETPLHFAVLHMGDLSGVKMLLKAGATGIVTQVNDSSFLTACRSGNFEAALFLMDTMMEMENPGPRSHLWREVARPGADLLRTVRAPWYHFFNNREPTDVGLDQAVWGQQQTELAQQILHVALGPVLWQPSPPESRGPDSFFVRLRGRPFYL